MIFLVCKGGCRSAGVSGRLYVAIPALFKTQKILRNGGM